MTSIKRHNSNNLREFLRALDREIASMAMGAPQELLIIGGAAALAYGYTRATLDIDLYRKMDDTIHLAVKRMRKRKGETIQSNTPRLRRLPRTLKADCATLNLMA